VRQTRETGNFRKKRIKGRACAWNSCVCRGKKVEKVIITVVAYNSEKIIEEEMNSVEECVAFKYQPGTNLWINVDGLDRVDVIEKIGSCFNIHPLTLEDVLNTGQRPKMEDYESYTYTVLK
jgi:magnesium transporter